jgi:predicted acylesterase/phospholipase RssA
VKVAEEPNKRSRHWVVDGGLLSNFPIRYFDSPPGESPPWPTFGLLLWEPTAGQPHCERIRSLISMTRAMVRTMNTAHDRRALEEADLKRIIKIPTGQGSYASRHRFEDPGRGSGSLEADQPAVRLGPQVGAY